MTRGSKGLLVVFSVGQIKSRLITSGGSLGCRASSFVNSPRTTFPAPLSFFTLRVTQLETSDQVGCLLCIASALHCTAVGRKTGVFVRHVVEYENGSFLTARQGSVPFRLPEPVVCGLLL